MIDSFMGENRWISNFHESPIAYGGRTFRNTEAAYQAEKFTDPELKDKFIGLDGKESKRLGDKMKELTRTDWFDINIMIMSEIIHAKFAQSTELCAMLIETGSKS